MNKIARTLLWGSLPALLIWALPAYAVVTNVTGPPRDNVDGIAAAAGVEVSFNSFRGGIIQRDTGVNAILASFSTNAVYSDNLQVFLIHNGISVELYRGEGDDEGSQLLATFSMAAEEAPPSTGGVNGTFLPVGDLDRFRGQDAAGIWTLRIVDPGGRTDGTNLETLVLSLDIEASSPTREVALFFDPGYVDTADEGESIRALLVDRNHNVETFVGISASAFASALVGKDVLLIPTLQQANRDPADLHLDLSDAARDVIRSFVAAGGAFITNSSFWGSNGALVNDLFGFGSESVGSLSGTIQDDATGTAFQAAPGVLVPVDLARGLDNLVPESISYFRGPQPFPDPESDVVVETPFPFDGSGGKVIWIAATYFNSIPLGTSDGGWPEVLDRAVVDDRGPFFTQQVVALFDDPAYVDDVNDAANLEASLTALGHDVRPFTGTTLAAVNAALADADVMLIPDPEVADPQPDFAASGAEAAIFDFVSGGGVLILHAANSEALLKAQLARDPLFTGDNSMDPLTTAAAGDFSGAITVPGTVFAEPGAFLEDNTTTEVLDFTAVVEARAVHLVYQVAANRATVALYRVGAGNLFWFGWDWEDSTQNGGWADALGRAASAAGPLAVPEAGAAASLFATFAGLLLLGRLRRDAPKRSGYSGSRNSRSAWITASG